MKFGFIIAAGNQTRFKSDVPKACAVVDPVNGTTALDINLFNLSKYCDQVYVVCSIDNEIYFSAIKDRIVIESGKGCGDAVLKALEAVDISDQDMCFIQWGDAIASDNVYSQLIQQTTRNDIISIACEGSTHPYTQIVPTTNLHIKVAYSKYGENVTAGFHDLSVFYGNALYILTELQLFKNKIYSAEENCYIHPHGNEMQFLDIFNDVEAQGSIVYIEDAVSFSFNTMEELENLIHDCKQRKSF